MGGTQASILHRASPDGLATGSSPFVGRSVALDLALVGDPHLMA